MKVSETPQKELAQGLQASGLARSKPVAKISQEVSLPYSSRGLPGRQEKGGSSHATYPLP
jgi:hypothetical protein